MATLDRISEVRAIIEDAISKGKDVNSLGVYDPHYIAIKNISIRNEDGKKISIDEKFELAGYPRIKKPTAIEKFKAVVEDYIARGGDLDELSSRSKEYKRLNGIIIRDDDGRALSFDEKFALAGFNKKPKMRTFTLAGLKEIIDPFVSSGGDVNKLGINDQIYWDVKAYKLKDESGRELTLEEKFALSGHPRARKIVPSAIKALTDAVDEFLEAGGSFDMPREKMPFRKLCESALSACKREWGENSLTRDEMMKRLGYRNYSDVYYSFSKVLDVVKYKDEEGFVDDYRKDEKYANQLIRLSERLGMPTSVMISLVGNANLKKNFLMTDYYKLITSDRDKYLEKHGSLVNIKDNDVRFYKRLTNYINRVYTFSYDKVNVDDLLETKDYQDSSVYVLQRDVTKENVEGIVERLLGIQSEKSEITKEDMSRHDYYILLSASAKVGTYLNDFLKVYGIKYRGQKHKRLSGAFFDEIPCLENMRSERDSEFERQTAKRELTTEEKFECYVDACQKAYEKYKSKIFNFMDEEMEEGLGKDKNR